MSHDFVEAVLLQRAGWRVHMVPAEDGSYEGLPPRLADLIAAIAAGLKAISSTSRSCPNAASPAWGACISPWGRCPTSSR